MVKTKKEVSRRTVLAGLIAGGLAILLSTFAVTYFPSNQQTNAPGMPSQEIPHISIACSSSQGDCTLHIRQILGDRNVSGTGYLQWDCQFRPGLPTSCQEAVISCPSTVAPINMTVSTTCSLQERGSSLPSAGASYTGTIYIFVEPGGGGVPFQIPFGGNFTQ